MKMSDPIQSIRSIHSKILNSTEPTSRYDDEHFGKSLGTKTLSRDRKNESNAFEGAKNNSLNDGKKAIEATKAKETVACSNVQKMALRHSPSKTSKSFNKLQERRISGHRCFSVYHGRARQPAKRGSPAQEMKSLREERRRQRRATEKYKTAHATRERLRVEAFNSAFTHLRRLLPTLPPDKKLSKIEVLRLAICYISYLFHVLKRT